MKSRRKQRPHLFLRLLADNSPDGLSRKAFRGRSGYAGPGFCPHNHIRGSKQKVHPGSCDGAFGSLHGLPTRTMTAGRAQCCLKRYSFASVLRHLAIASALDTGTGDSQLLKLYRTSILGYSHVWKRRNSRLFSADSNCTS